MNRRHFLNLLGMGAAGLVLDPERLLWVPGARKIFIPPVLAVAGSSEVVGHQIWGSAGEGMPYRLLASKVGPFFGFDTSWLEDHFTDSNPLPQKS